METRELFVNQLMEVLMTKFGVGCMVERMDVTKNNGTIHEAVVVRTEGSSTAPVIYTDQLYSQFLNGKSIQELVAGISERIEGEMEMARQEAFKAMDFEACKNQIMMKLVNADRNHEILKSIPHRRYLDLAVVYFVALGMKDECMISTTITNTMLTHWKISVEELHSFAVKNTKRAFPVRISRIEAMLFGGAEEDMLVFAEDSLYPEMFVLTNSVGIYGATVLLYPNVLQDIANRNHTDLIVLPSSVHETLIMRADNGMSMSDLNRMIRDINEESVEEEEQLASHYYLFRREEGKLLSSDENMSLVVA